jgi:hypothetical protein
VAATPTGAPGFLAAPTPGMPNESLRMWRVAPVATDVPRGYHEMPFVVRLSCPTTGATIRYTLDCTVPTSTSGTAYTGALLIMESSVIRAVAFASNMLPSEVATHTYLGINQVIGQTDSQAARGFPATWTTIEGETRTADYAMDTRVTQNPAYTGDLRRTLLEFPSLSIVTEMETLFDTTNGMYANPRKRGDEWEPFVSLEYFNAPDDSTGFAVNCGLSIQGEINRYPHYTKKHSLQLLFKSKFGPGKLRYPFFRRSGIAEHDTIILRCMFGDGWCGLNNTRNNAQMLRDQFAHDAQGDMGWLHTDGEFVHVYLNGLYWGLYNANERPDAAFMQDHLDHPKEEWDVLKGNIGLHAAQLKEGSRAAYDVMMDLVPKNITTIDAGDYETLTQYLDMDQYIDYMILEIFIANGDWPQKNWYVVGRRNPTNAAGPPALRFRFYTWDSEASLFSYTADRSNVGDDGSNHDIGPGRIYRRCRRLPRFQRHFGDRVHKHLFNDGALTPAPNSARYVMRAFAIKEAVAGESARWGDSSGRLVYPSTWAAGVRGMTGSYFQLRNPYVIEQFRGKNLYPAIDAPGFSQHGGAITSGFALTITAAVGTIYYTLDGSDPWEWGSGVAGSALLYSNPVVLTGNTRVRARAYGSNTWSALNEAVFVAGVPPVRVSELMYHPAPGPGYADDDFEFIELYNRSNVPVALRTLALTDGIGFSFSNQALVCPGDTCVVLVRNLAAFTARYGTNGIMIGGEYAGSLANSSERIEVSDALAGSVQAFTYDDAWHPYTDGNGPSLEIRDPDGPPEQWGTAAGWQASSEPLGTPGYIIPEPGLALFWLPGMLGLWRRRAFA